MAAHSQVKVDPPGAVTPKLKKVKIMDPVLLSLFMRHNEKCATPLMTDLMVSSFHN